MARRNRRGQSTTEFALMIPLIFALLFAVIEYAYYMGAVHYVNYATFSAARAFQVNGDPDQVLTELLTGNMVDYTAGDVTMNADSATGRIQTFFTWEAQTPGFNLVMGDMSTNMSVTLGPPECRYEELDAVRDAGLPDSVFTMSDNVLPCY